MDKVVPVVSVVSQALSSNLFGLRCPLHCQQFPTSAFLLCFVIGWLLGLCSAVGLTIYCWPYFVPLAPTRSSSSPSPAQSRLISYLHERGLRSRHHWDHCSARWAVCHRPWPCCASFRACRRPLQELFPRLPGWGVPGQRANTHWWRRPVECQPEELQPPRQNPGWKPERRSRGLLRLALITSTLWVTGWLGLLGLQQAGLRGLGKQVSGLRLLSPDELSLPTAHPRLISAPGTTSFSRVTGCPSQSATNPAVAIGESLDRCKDPRRCPILGHQRLRP